MKKPPRPITIGYLQAVTGRYLERYATSSSHLRRLLMQRVYRSVAHHGHDLAEKTSLVDAEIARLLRSGVLDDARYAADKAQSLHRRGSGARKIQATLAAKGVSTTHIADAISEVDGDWEAALTYARKRRLGPWREVAPDEARRRKELARLGRAGFSWDVARRIVELESVPE